jgi:RNA polymerase sigma factor (sigma-70 family)
MDAATLEPPTDMTSPPPTPIASDRELLRRYTGDRSHEAFRVLVERHVGLVYAAARRQLRTDDADQADDVTQAVFILLARKAASISLDVSLPGWLYNAARMTAANARRAGERRRRLERKAGDAMRERLGTSTSTDLAWSDIEPELDDALARLGSRDREVIVLRFLSSMSLREVGDAVGVTEDAARVRVARSLAKLRRLMGVTAPVTSLAVALETGAGHAATPPHLAAAIATKAVATSATTAAATATAMTMTTKLAASLLIGVGAIGAAVALPPSSASRPTTAVVTTKPAMTPTAPTTRRIIGDSPRGVVVGMLMAAARGDRETIRSLFVIRTPDDERAADAAIDLFVAEGRFDSTIAAKFPNAPDRGMTRLGRKLTDITLARDDVRGDAGSIVLNRPGPVIAGFIKDGPQWKLLPSVIILEGGPAESFERRRAQASALAVALDEVAALAEAGHYATRDDAIIDLDRRAKSFLPPATRPARR